MRTIGKCIFINVNYSSGYVHAERRVKQSLHASLSIASKPSHKSTLVNDLPPLNVMALMDFTVEGILIFVNEWQSVNARCLVVIYGKKIFAENNILQCSAVPKYLSANGSECLGCEWLAMMNMTRSHHCQWQADHVVLDQSSSMMYRRQMPFHQSLEDNLVKQPPLCHAFYGIHSLQWM